MADCHWEDANEWAMTQSGLSLGGWTFDNHGREMIAEFRLFQTNILKTVQLC